MEVMRDPVMTVDGQTYERVEIEKWFALGNKTSPLTGEELPSTNLFSNIALRTVIRESGLLRSGWWDTGVDKSLVVLDLVGCAAPTSVQWEKEREEFSNNQSLSLAHSPLTLSNLAYPIFFPLLGYPLPPLHLVCARLLDPPVMAFTLS
jgi:hypothetical protein